MDPFGTLQLVRSFPKENAVAAYDFAEFLEDLGIEAQILPAGQDDTESEIAVFVSERHYQKTLDLERSFFEDNETGRRTSFNSADLPTGYRGLAYLYGIGMPIFVAIVSGFSLWRALFRSDMAQDWDLGMGIMGLLVSIGWIAGFIVLKRKT